MERQRIRELRAGLGLSQEGFARLVGVSMQTVRRWESGISRPLPIVSVKLAELLAHSRAAPAPEGGMAMRGTQGARGGGVDVGLGALFKGLGSLLDVVAKLEESGSSATGQVEALGGRAKAVYGVTVKVGLGGKPVIEPFGNIRGTERGPVVEESREPATDLMDEGDHIAVLVELPGVEEKDVRVNVKGDGLEVAAATGERRYHKEVALPGPVDPASLKFSYRNGLLEITLAKKK